MTAQLARQQRRLNASLPLVLMTDDRKADWAGAARALPHGSLVVIRAHKAKRRRALAEELYGLARLLIAGDPGLAEDIGAAGLHLPEVRMREAGHWRMRHPDWIITSSAHSLRALMHVAHLDAVFLSPVFATTSHQSAKPLMPQRAAMIAARGEVPVYALGGVTVRNGVLLAPAFSGIAAITSLLCSPSRA